MSNSSNAAICRTFVQKVYNEGRLELIGDFVADGMIDHGLGPGAPERRSTPRRIASQLSLYRLALPDLHVEIEDLLTKEDRVVMLWRMTGTYAGPMTGMSGQRVEVSGIRIDRLADGKIVESWGNWDALGRFGRTGILPGSHRALERAA